MNFGVILRHVDSSLVSIFLDSAEALNFAVERGTFWRRKVVNTVNAVKFEPDILYFRSYF